MVLDVSQPLVPDVIPKVLLPEVPLVVAATTWEATPDWPLKSMEPQPQPGPVSLAMANELAVNITKPVRIGRIINKFLILIRNCFITGIGSIRE